MINNGVQACMDAFERLKNNAPTVSKFQNIAPSCITASVVSQEAGFDSGYLKSSRANHRALIMLIETHRNAAKEKVPNNTELINRERQKTQRHKEARILAEQRLEEALGRELVLVSYLRELEKQLSKYVNIVELRNAGKVTYL